MGGKGIQKLLHGVGYALGRHVHTQWSNFNGYTGSSGTYRLGKTVPVRGQYGRTCS